MRSACDAALPEAASIPSPHASSSAADAPAPHRVVIVGAGWAGLAAAVTLTAHGTQVTVLEAARQAGGRARRVTCTGQTLDNGPHLLLGAYRTLLDLLQLMGVAEERVLMRQPFGLALRSVGGRELRIAPSRLPGPLHVMSGLLRGTGLSWPERFAALSFCGRLVRDSFEPPEDTSVAEYLQTHCHAPRFARDFLEPLCLAALNTPPAQASARLFLNVLRRAFSGRRDASDLLIPRCDLSALFPRPATAYIAQHGGELRYATRATALRVNGDRVIAVDTNRGTIRTSRVILACSSQAAQRLLSPHNQCREAVAQMRTLEPSPISTVYLHYRPNIRMDTPLLGVLDATTQWVFDRRICGQPGVMAAVISGPGAHLSVHPSALAQQVSGELAQLFPHWPAPQHHRVIKERRATFMASTGVERHRPAVDLPLHGCWLAGDYTAIDLPATLEGALLSGLRSARRALQSAPHTPVEF